MNIRELMTDRALFGNLFAGDSWAAWRALLAGFYGLELTDEEAGLFEQLTGRTEAPESPYEELWQVIGRRGGKSQIAALLAVYESCFRDHRDKLAPGEVATVRVMAADRAQARAVMRYTIGLLESNAMLKRLIAKQSPERIELTTRCEIEVGTASFRASRGYSFAAVICDEIAFWRSDQTANPDAEIIAAVRPGLTTLNGKLICISSPYRKAGELYRHWVKYYGQPGPVLVAQAPTRMMNPTVKQRIIDDALERDESAAKAEYLAQFRDDLEDYISRDVIRKLVRPAPLQNGYSGKRHYYGFADPAGGGKDEYTLAIGHRDGERIVVDALEARKGVPADITAEYAKLLKFYGISSITGDKYAGSWPGDAFKKHGITYRSNAKPKGELYIDLLPRLNNAQIELPPDDRLVNQLCSLERRTSRTGRDSIDHPPGGHDDRANAVAGLVAAASIPKSKMTIKRYVF